MSIICPVILCGGSGTRLWPISRELHPKQFIPFKGDTLFGKTLDRAAALPHAGDTYIVCNEIHRFFATGIAAEKKHSIAVLLEPEPKNTAPAAAMAAFAAHDNGSDPLLLIMPSDHSIEPVEHFLPAVEQAVPQAHADLLLTFGIPPARPETGYGYIQRGTPLPGGGHMVKRFVEKPEPAEAAQLAASPDCLWNSGIFLVKASVFLTELQRLSPGLHAACRAAWETRCRDGMFLRFAADVFAKIPANSIDYAVMEHTDKAAVVELAARWNDLGSWTAFYNEMPHDDHGNACVGDTVLHRAENCYVHSSSRLVAALDVRDIAIVETADAVVVMDRNATQGVKDLLAALKAAGRPETEAHLRVYRPWGSYEILAQAPGFQVKRIIVKPGAALSSQYHHHRAEHWVVVRGTAKVTNNNETTLFSEDQSTYIPVGAAHRLENPGVIPLEIIEVQSGNYLGEDDIVRLEDMYSRG